MNSKNLKENSQLKKLVKYLFVEKNKYSQSGGKAKKGCAVKISTNFERGDDARCGSVNYGKGYSFASRKKSNSSVLTKAGAAGTANNFICHSC